MADLLVGKFVNWRDLQFERVIVEKPVPRQYDKGGGQKGSYTTADVKYLYPMPDGRNVSDSLYIELMECEVEGFQEPRPSKDGSVAAKPGELQVKTVFGIAKSETREFLAFMEKLWSKICELIIPHRMELKSKDFGPQTARALCKELIYRPTDAITGVVDETKNASQFFKVIKSGRGQTKFRNLQKQGCEMTIEELKNSQYTGIPLIQYKSLYSGGNGKISVQGSLNSMVIKRIGTLGSTNRQVATIERLQKENPELIEQQKRDLLALTGTMPDLAGMSTSSVMSGRTQARDQTPLSDTAVSLSKSEPTTTTVTQTPVQQTLIPQSVVPPPTLNVATMPGLPLPPNPSMLTMPPGSLQQILTPGAAPGYQIPPGFQMPPGYQIPTK